MRMKRVLVIAGSDSGGGAGIQADIKTIAARGVYGMTAITALTAQNTMGVEDVFEIPLAFVGRQIDVVMKDIGANVWKTGMLSSREIIGLVAGRARDYLVDRLIVDPVMVAKGGSLLLKTDAKDALIRELFPVAFAITPNHHEAQELTGLEIKTPQDMEEAARKLHQMGPRYVIVKGGDLPKEQDALDILYDGGSFFTLRARRRQTYNTHGTGCTFASAFAAEIARGQPVLDAARLAKRYVTAAIDYADEMDIGNGNGPLNHFFGKVTPLPDESSQTTKS
ncbi:bifunctional hydroxymethylpyrimidine kinase/phosphomethylpyrimidine kinase [Myxococcota bacterium]|nr:bifunctional hydroxymethylpyrimidine kinase/phosphomethylpyrimidine kinase [Myxococcota bacterium]